MPDKHNVLFVGRQQTLDDLKVHLQKISTINLHHEDASAVEEMKKGHADIILVETSNTHEHTCAVLDEISARNPDSILVLLAPTKPDPDKVLQYMAYGVRDLLTNDDNPELVIQKAIGQLARRVAAGHIDSSRLGRVVSFFSSKGGVGKTFLTITTGRWISRSTEAKTILVDLDLQFGDMDLYMDANSVQTIGELMEEVKNNGGRLTDFILESHIHQVSPQLHMLSAPLSPEKAEMIDAAAVGQLIKVLKKRYDFILFDTGAGVNDVTLTVFDKSDRIFLVVDDQVAAVKNTGQIFQLLQKLNYPDSKTDYIVNRFSDKYPLDGGMLVKILARNPYHRVPLSSAVRESINGGYNLVEKKPSDPASQGIRQFVQKLLAESNLQIQDRAAGPAAPAGAMTKIKALFAKA